MAKKPLKFDVKSIPVIRYLRANHQYPGGDWVYSRGVDIYIHPSGAVANWSYSVGGYNGDDPVNAGFWIYPPDGGTPVRLNMELK